MGKIIEVTSFEEMEQTAVKLKEISETYTAIYTRLMEDANTMGNAWRGADNQAFVEQINGFTENLKNMAEKLVAVSEALRQQKNNYMNRQENNIQNVKKLTN